MRALARREIKETLLNRPEMLQKDEIENMLWILIAITSDWLSWLFLNCFQQLRHHEFQESFPLGMMSLVEFWRQGSTGSRFLPKTSVLEKILSWSYFPWLSKGKLSKKVLLNWYSQMKKTQNFSTTHLKVSWESFQKQYFSRINFWAKSYSQLTLVLKTPQLFPLYSIWFLSTGNVPSWKWQAGWLWCDWLGRTL